MRIGLIGVGRIGAFHASTLRGLPGVDSLIVTDVDLTRTRDVARQVGARAMTSGSRYSARRAASARGLTTTCRCAPPSPA